MHQVNPPKGEKMGEKKIRDIQLMLGTHVIFTSSLGLEARKAGRKNGSVVN